MDLRGSLGIINQIVGTARVVDLLDELPVVSGPIEYLEVCHLFEPVSCLVLG